MNFIEWWNLPHSAEGADDPIQFAEAAWNEQQRKIDALEAKLAIAVDEIKQIGYSARNNFSSQGIWIREKCDKALATINAKEKVG